MKKFILLLIVAVIATPAFAGDFNYKPTYNEGGTAFAGASAGAISANKNTNINGNSNRNTNVNVLDQYTNVEVYNKAYNKNVQGQYQDQEQYQGQQQGQIGINKAVGSGNETNTNVSFHDEGEKRAVRSVPNLGGLPSGPCTGRSGGLTLGFPLFAGGVQGAGIDEGCDQRETARALLNHAGSGAYENADAEQMLNVAKTILLSSPAARKALKQIEEGESADTALIPVEASDSLAQREDAKRSAHRATQSGYFTYMQY